jgi:hypothetical protein
MKRTGSAERAFRVGFSAAIATDKPGKKLESFHLCYFPCFCQFTDMHFMVLRVGAKIVNVRESVAHGILLFFPASFLGRRRKYYNSFNSFKPYQAETFSSTIAIPWPPPIHSDAKPSAWSSRFICFIRVSRIRAPVQPMG